MLSAQFREFAAALPSVTDREVALYEAHLNLLRKWNENMSLVSPKSLETALGTHYADSLFTVEFASAHTKGLALHDLGTGAGFPGIVQAIRYPERPITLYEKSLKKQSFLLAAIANLGLTNVTLEGALPDERHRGLFFARAVLPHEKIFKFFQQHLAPGACLIRNLGGGSEPFPVPTFFLKEAEAEYTLPQGCGNRRVELLRFVPRGTK